MGKEAVSVSIRLKAVGIIAAALVALGCSWAVAGAAYASEWSDMMVARIDALPDASAMTMEQTKEARNITSEIASAIGTRADEELLAIGSARIEKLSGYGERQDQLDAQMVASAKKAKVSGVKVTAKKGKAVVKWNKLLKEDELSSGVKVVSGYEVLMSTKKNKGFKEVETVYVGDKSKASYKKTITGLTKGKRYYFKVRALVFDPEDDESDGYLHSKASKVVRSKKIK